MQIPVYMQVKNKQKIIKFYYRYLVFTALPLEISVPEFEGNVGHVEPPSGHLKIHVSPK